MNIGYGDERTDSPGASPCRQDWEEVLGAYADGELPWHRQASLFRHLADCAACRKHLDVILVFRRMIRNESVMVPPMADAALMARLDVLQKRALENDKPRSLWDTKMKVGLGRMVLVTVVVFLLGAGITRVSNDVPRSFVSAIQEQVVPTDSQATFWRVEPVYVFYPGLTIEADKTVE